MQPYTIDQENICFVCNLIVVHASISCNDAHLPEIIMSYLIFYGSLF